MATSFPSLIAKTFIYYITHENAQMKKIIAEQVLSSKLTPGKQGQSPKT